MLTKKLWTYFDAPVVWFITLVMEIFMQIYFWSKLKRKLLISVVLKIPFVSTITNASQNLLIYALKMGPVPKHVSFIMDGNRRYARNQNMPLKEGHEAGGVTLLTLLYICKKVGVKCVSCYAFSIENFKRPKEEVETLMELFSIKLNDFANRANDYKDPLYGSKLRIVGDKTLLSREIKEKIQIVESLTSTGENFTVYICLPYTSRNDIHHSICKNVLISLQHKIIKEKEITKDSLSNEMYFERFSNKCDLVIRTSGHKRLSDYMLWQCHENSTIEFSDSLWPDFAFFEMYIMILKWAFFQNIQNYKDSAFTIKRKLGEKHFLFEKEEKSFNYFDLPNPPQAVSVIEKKG